MKRYVPFALAFAGVVATIGVLFLLVRLDALPKGIREIDWRRVVGDDTVEPIEAGAEG